MYLSSIINIQIEPWIFKKVFFRKQRT